MSYKEVVPREVVKVDLPASLASGLNETFKLLNDYLKIPQTCASPVSFPTQVVATYDLSENTKLILDIRPSGEGYTLEGRIVGPNEEKHQEARNKLNGLPSLVNSS